jgi:hypothetical protein
VSRLRSFQRSSKSSPRRRPVRIAVHTSSPDPFYVQKRAYAAYENEFADD